MPVKYAVQKKLVVAADLKKRWLSATTEAAGKPENAKAKNCIPALKEEMSNE